MKRELFKGAKIGKFDANLTEISEGDIISVAGETVNKKVVYGQTSVKTYDIIGFFLVGENVEGFYDSDALVKWYPNTFSIESAKSPIIVGTIYKNKL